MSTFDAQFIDRKVVLAEALLKTAERLGLKQVQLASVIGVELAIINQMETNPVLDPTSQQGKSALSLIRLYQALHGLTGGDPVWINHFMNSQNTITGDIPIQQIQTKNGLVKVLEFVEALSVK